MAELEDRNEIRETVRERYAAAAATESSGCCGSSSSCCGSEEQTKDGFGSEL